MPQKLVSDYEGNVSNIVIGSKMLKGQVLVNNEIDE